MRIRAEVHQVGDGRWEGEANLSPPVRAAGRSRNGCITALRRAVERSIGDRAASRPIALIVEVQPVLAGVAEAAQVMGWDKRRVITYIDRGSFPAPLQSLASGRIWLRSDVERFAAEWRARQARRPRRVSQGSRTKPS